MEKKEQDILKALMITLVTRFKVVTVRMLPCHEAMVNKLVFQTVIVVVNPIFIWITYCGNLD